MNRDLYRLIFNAARGIFMAVAETATGHGKGTRRARSPRDHVMTPVAHAAGSGTRLALGLGASLLLAAAPLANAQIIADPSAPASQRAIILKAPNGVPLVNIQTPSAAGVSRNTYSQFDVQRNGAILNNARANVQTQLGGFIQGNPYLATGSAKVIVNEVNSSNPSLLKGAMEVAGQRADVIVANPSGIRVDGATFINAGNVVLSTSRPQYGATGDLESYRVRKGTVVIEGLGMDTRTASTTDILTRAMQVNAQLWANYLRVTTGANDVRAADPANPTSAEPDTTIPKPKFMLDIAAIGGMYAGHIFLVGTEQGLGANNAGALQSNSEMVLLPNGWLVNAGSVQAAGNVQVGAAGVHNTATGTIYAGGNANITTTSQPATGGGIVNAGVIAAQGNVTLQATSGAASGPPGNAAEAQITAAAGSRIMAGLNADGTLGNAGTLNIATAGAVTLGGSAAAATMNVNAGTTLDASGGTLTAGQMSLAAPTITNAGGQIAASDSLRLDAASITNTQGTLASQGALTLNATADVSNMAGTVSSQGPLRVTAMNVSNSGLIVSGNALDVAAATLRNTNGTIASQGAQTLTASGALTNEAGTLSSQGGLTLSAPTLANTGGSIGAKDALTITAASLHNTSGAIIGQAAVTLSGADVANTGGQIQAIGDLTVNASGAVTNTGGLIRGAGTVSVNAASIHNTDTGATDQGIEGAAIALTAATLHNQSGAIRAQGELRITASDALHNDAGLLSAGGALRIADAASAAAAPPRTLAVTNTAGTLVAGQSASITAASLTGTGQILSQGTLSLDTAADLANDGRIAANGDVTLTSAGTVTNSGQIQSGGTLTVQAASIANTAAGEIAGTTTQLTANSVTNRGLIDGQDTRIDAGTVLNIGTGRIYGDHVSIAATSLTNTAETVNGATTAATIAARDRLDIGAATLTNSEGALLYSAGELAIGGALDASRQATGQAQTVTNSSAQIEAAGALTITAASLLNDNAHYSVTEQAQAAHQVVQHAEAGGQRLDSTQVRLCDAMGCAAGDDLAWLGNNDRRKLLLPSADFPFDAFAAYYANFPALSSDWYDPNCNGESACMTAGRWYVNDDPIWAAFGVKPYLVPEPPLDTANPCNHLTTECKVGADGYMSGSGDSGNWVAFDAPVTQAQLQEWQTHYTWRQAYEAAHAALDVRLAQFTASIAPRLRQNWTYWTYTEQGTQQVLATSAPARIGSGGAMTLQIAGEARNRASQIIAGGTLAITGAQVTNESVQGQSTTSQMGQVVHTYATDCENCQGDDRAHDAQPYQVVTGATVPLAAALTQGNTPITLSGASPGALGLQALGAGPAALGGVGRPALVQVSAAGGGAIRTSMPQLTGLGASLYRSAPPTALYLVETDPRFADYSQWLTSSYMLAALGIEPTALPKRLGDGFIEQQLVREQINALTGQRYLADYSDQDAQYQALMDAGVTYAKQYDLRPGIALTAAQMAQLTSDIVWLVEQDVQLADGSTARALVPQVYVRVKDGDLDGTGALLAGASVNIKTTGDQTNSGTIAGRQLVTLDARNVANLQGRIEAASVTVKAAVDVNDVGGRIAAQEALRIAAGRDVNVASTTSEGATATESTAHSAQGIGRVAGLYVTGDKGLLIASAWRDVNLVAAQVVNGPAASASSSAGGTTVIAAGRDINLGTLTASSSESVAWNASNRRAQTSSTEVGSQIQGAGSVTMSAGQDVNAKAASVQASGALTVQAGRDVNLQAGQASDAVDEAHRYTSKGFLSTTTTTTRDAVSTSQAQGTSLGGATVSIAAGRDVNVKGSSVIGDAGVTVQAVRDVTIEAATDTSSQTHDRTQKKSGLFGSGGFGVTIGTREQATDTTSVTTSAAASTIGAISGDVNVKAGGTYTQTGSDVMAPAGDVNIAASKVAITEERDTSTTTTEQRFKQSGLTVAISSPVIAAAQTVQQMAKAAGDTSDGRMKALAAASGALAVKDAAAAVAQDGASAASGGGMNLSISVGSASSKSTTVQTSDTARGSKIAAGGSVNISATAQDKASTLTIRGSDVTAGNAVNLTADGDVLLEAAKNTSSLTGSNSSSSDAIGVGIGTSGMGVTASASKGSGSEAGADTTYSNTHITAGNRVSIQSGGDTTLRGAVVKADSVQTDVGGNLNIESLQDTSTYKSQQKSVGGSVTIGMGGSASFSASKSTIDSSYASVAEQSGIRAGDGGFQVNVKGETDLKGGAITSTQKAIDDGKNSFKSEGGLTISDIQNSASYDAKSAGISVGAAPSLNGKLGPQGTSFGFGKDSGSAASITQAAISGIAGNKAARTGDAEAGIVPIFDKDKVQKEVDAQRTITQEAGRRVLKYAADKMGQKAQALRQEAASETDPAKRQALLDEAANWDEGGAYRSAVHAAIGGLMGGTGGALGAGTVALSANAIDSLTQGMSVEARSIVGAAIAAGIGGATGGIAGAATGFNVDVNNRQLHPTEARLIKDNAKTYATQRGISVAQAEAELTQQALRDVDSAHDTRLGSDDVQAQAFLNQLGAGKSMRDSLTGQSYQLFAADEATRADHAMFGQYSKTSPSVMAALDRAYQSAYKPKDGQTIAGVNGSNGGALTGSDLALNDAATDYAHMRQQPAVVQWTVLGELRSERRDNLQTQLQLTQELQGLNAAGDTSAQATQRRGDIITRLTQLQSEDQTLRQASVEQIRTMNGAGLLNAADQREWIEGSGAAIAASGLSARGISAAAIEARIGALKSASEESAALAASAKAEAQARISNNASRDGSSYFAETYTNLKAAAAQARTELGAAGTDAATGKPLGNVAVAQVNIYGQGSEMVSASSRVGNDPASAVPGYVTLPPADKRVLKPLQSAEDPIPRSVDTEYKILENFAQQNIGNTSVNGSISLFTERPPCYSCTSVIEKQFNNLFPNMQVLVYHANGEISSYVNGTVQSIKVPSSNKQEWTTMPSERK